MHKALSIGRSFSRGTMLVLAAVLLAFPWRSAAPPPAHAAPLAPVDRCDWSGQVYADFYVPPPLGKLTPDRLGEILRVEHIRTYTRAQVADAASLPSSPYGAEAYRILYLSQEPVGTPKAISGLIVMPTGAVPPAGFPVIVDGHPTVGLADICAPSRSQARPQVLLPYVAQGYVVAATDYLGLGTPGPHPYAVGAVEGRSMLDSGRAALRFCDTEHGILPLAVNQMTLEGHSQGGHAALFAQEMWPAYAPELNIRGTIAFAPGSEPRLLAETMAKSVTSALVMPVSLAMYSMSRYYGAPSDLATWLQEPYASDLPERSEDQCYIALTAWLGFRPSRVLLDDLLSAVAAGRWEDIPLWKDYLNLSTPGNYASRAPVLIIQGGNDPIVPVAASVKLQQRLCAHGTVTKLSLYPDGDHNGPLYAMPEALQWAADRFTGKPPAGGCFVPWSSFLPFVAR